MRGESFNASRDETDLPSTGQLPTHIVVFEAAEKRMAGWLRSHNYALARRFFHCHVKGDVDIPDDDASPTVAVYRHVTWSTWALMAGQSSHPPELLRVLANFGTRLLAQLGEVGNQLVAALSTAAERLPPAWQVWKE